MFSSDDDDFTDFEEESASGSVVLDTLQPSLSVHLADSHQLYPGTMAPDTLPPSLPSLATQEFCHGSVIPETIPPSLLSCLDDSQEFSHSSIIRETIPLSLPPIIPETPEFSRKKRSIILHARNSCIVPRSVVKH